MKMDLMRNGKQVWNPDQCVENGLEQTRRMSKKMKLLITVELPSINFVKGMKEIDCWN